MTTPPLSDPPTAAVLGGSIAGLMASLVLHYNGFEVIYYERQAQYIRSIQWTVRQSFIDYLSSFDKEIAGHVLKLVSPITNGYRFLSDTTLRYPDGAYKHRSRDYPQPGDGVAPTECCGKSLEDKAVGIIRARQLETCLREQIRAKKIARLFDRDAPDLVDSGNRYALSAGVGQPPTPYELIVVCEGAGSKTRGKAGIKSILLSRERAQVAGDVKLKRNGMVIQYQHAKIDKNDKNDENLKNLPSGELLYSTLLSTDHDDTSCWVIGDVSTEFVTKVAGTAEGSDERNDLIKEECEKIATRTLLETDQAVKDAGVTGVFGETVRKFVSQAQISSAACAKDNLVLAGDAVGAGHWAVGGGMHVAGMCHQRRLQGLAAVFAETDRAGALKKYSDGVIEDTMAWISQSMEFYYLSIPKDVVEAVFKDVMKALKLDSSIDCPAEIQERIISLYFGPKTPTKSKDAGFTDRL
jgi:2-polyprenyl-6-methoxyphenol hydroxylase-like FAD-dependent oxidoreductase